MRKTIILLIGVLIASSAIAQQTDTLSRTLGEVSIKQRRAQRVSRLSGAENGNQIGQDELFRAACCNLGESFVSNPSVDVNYNDAAVGARQIKLLGLSGQYVQMLSENLPMATGAASPYLLGYVPGSWMKSIAVSKGASSVKNGPQSITGQINIEYLKPDDEPGITLNLYGDSHQKTEANLTANTHLNSHLSTELLAHYEREFGHHDYNHDGWIDMPAVKQLHLQNRWKYQRGRYIMHAGIGFLDETRHGGQHHAYDSLEKAKIHIAVRRYEAYMKHAYLLDRSHNTNLALLATASRFDMNATFVSRSYGVLQDNLNAQLLLEHDFTDAHQLSAGLNITSERLNEFDANIDATETTPGAYLQYTFTPSYHFTAMAGLRADHSSFYGTYLTPRLHIKWTPSDFLTLRASAGKGYRTPHPLAEYHYLLTSGRTLTIDSYIEQEQAWNTGLSASFYIPLADRTLTLNAEYYYTHFLQQTVVDFDSDPTTLHIGNLRGRSFSHTAQIDASYDLTDDLNLLAAFRYNDVRCTYGGILREKPLQSRYKGLLTLAWKPRMGIWQFDLTLQINGPGRMPQPYTNPDGTPSWSETFPAYPQLNLQITREFRHFSLYLGGENLTNYRQPNPIINASDPWSPTFDPTLVWGPIYGIMAYAGIRMKL